MRNKFLLLSMIITINTLTTNAQNNSYTINAAGESVTISGNIYEWSIGEMILVNTANTPNLIVTQGLLQKTDGSIGIKDLELSDNQLSVYPNPMTDFLFLKTDVPANTNLDIAIFDLSGKLHQREKIHIQSNNEVQHIDFTPYAAGSYIMEIKTTINGNFYKNTFKIQNHN